MPIDLSQEELDRRRPMSGQVYVMLRSLILTGSIKPGELIDEKLIASQLAISRTPVREAVKRLRDEHLVDVVAQSATRASQLESDSIHEAFLIRRALEMESAAQAAVAMEQRHADDLAAIIERHTRIIGSREYSKAIEIDDEFHAYIAGICGLSRLWRTVEISKAQLDRCRHILLPRFGQAEKTIEQHREILRALNTGDANKASAAMQRHLDFAYESAVTLLLSSELSFPLARKPGGRLRKTPDPQT
ncbi:MAG: GntR family transcriptional regulator [Gammaproteobacteria bacterium]|nr:GntR family transcriptional regulator [Gammaproteobacteria bacterium]